MNDHVGYVRAELDAGQDCDGITMVVGIPRPPLWRRLLDAFGPPREVVASVTLRYAAGPATTAEPHRWRLFKAWARVPTEAVAVILTVQAQIDDGQVFYLDRAPRLEIEP